MMKSLNNFSAEYLFEKVNRKRVFSILMRKIYKISHNELRNFDFFIHDYLRIEIRQEFNKHNKITSIEQIKEKFFEGEKILEDLENIIKKDYKNVVFREKRFINIPMAQSNYLVKFEIFIFII